MASSEQTAVMTNGLYEIIKNYALLILPALATLYFGIAQIWGLEHGPEVVATITAIDTFLGVILKLSSKAYYKNGANFDGELNVTETEEGGKKAQFVFNDEPADLVDEPGKHSLEFKINKIG